MNTNEDISRLCRSETAVDQPLDIGDMVLTHHSFTQGSRKSVCSETPHPTQCPRRQGHRPPGLRGVHQERLQGGLVGWIEGE